MVDKVLMNVKENYAVIYFEDGRTFKLSPGKDTNIMRFYNWFMSWKNYKLLNDEEHKASEEVTLVTEINRAA